MIDHEIRLLFLNYDMNKSSFRKELEATTNETTKVDLKKKIKNLNKLQLELIEEYIELVGSNIPLEMQCYFTGEKPHADELEILENWMIAYNGGEE
tara:strand:- start:469 stop:756 length:288 start_codon:yes stop_codon:yes gene_type:complete